MSKDLRQNYDVIKDEESISNLQACATSPGAELSLTDAPFAFSLNTCTELSTWFTATTSPLILTCTGAFMLFSIGMSHFGLSSVEFDSFDVNCFRSHTLMKPSVNAAAKSYDSPC